MTPGQSCPLRLMQAVGVELEYMIVDGDTLGVLPVADRLLRDVAGSDGWVSEVEPDDTSGIGWSNELVNHVVELKTARPVATLAGLAPRFQGQVCDANRRLAALGGRLLPGAMHPWMDPLVETRLWPHETSPVYERYDAIFSCRGHGWSNLQSSHVNLPFGDDAEFGRLHAAIRLVLPLLPALAASSPVIEGERTGFADSRLAAYRENCRRIPSIAGEIIPEPLYDRRSYEREVLDRIADDVRPFDPEGVLRPEFTNSRGAIARFDRGSIEIRLIDVQEHPAADIAIADLVCRTIAALLEERWMSIEEVGSVPTARLVAVLEATVRAGEAAEVRDVQLLRALGRGGVDAAAGAVWTGIRADVAGPGRPGVGGGDTDAAVRVALDAIEDHGTLATRITRRLEAGSSLRDVYAELADCLEVGRSLT